MIRAKMILLLVLLHALISQQLAGAEYRIQNSVCGNGGATVGNGSCRMIGTVGQPAIGVTGDEGHVLPGGFWYLITVIPENPVADADGPYTGQEGAPMAFDGTGSYDPDGSIASYDWTFGDGDTGTGPTPTHTYADNDEYAVTLTVTDNDGLTDTDTTQATVNNAAPVVDAGPNQTVDPGATVTIGATFTDPGVADTHSATIDWGDGTVEPGAVTEPIPPAEGTVTGSHMYTDDGTYIVTVTVTDDDSGIGTDDLTVTVGTPQECTLTVAVDPPGSGSVDLDPPGGTYECGTQVTLTAVPNSCWGFDHWSGDLSGNTNPATITVDSDKNVTAHFQGMPDITVEPSSWDYGGISVGNTVCKTFAVYNPGCAEMCVTEIKRTGHTDFSIQSGGDPFCLNPGETHHMEVCFAPTSAKTMSATLSLMNDVPGKNPLAVPLQGKGVCPSTVISSDPVVHSELRQLRDTVLTKNEAGQELIHLYYERSSEVVDILVENPMLLLRGAAILKEVMPGIIFLLGDRKGRDIVMTPVLVARITTLFADMGKEGSEGLAQTLSKLSDRLKEYEWMRFSQIWEVMDRGHPEAFALLQNHPNPFNPDTWIPYQLREDADVLVRIYDAAGRLMRTLSLGHKPAGFYVSRDRAVYWDGRNESGEQVASGIYFYTIQAGGYTAIRKMVVEQ